MDSNKEYPNIPKEIQESIMSLYPEAPLHDPLLTQLDAILTGVKECDAIAAIVGTQAFGNSLARRSLWKDLRPGERRDHVRDEEERIEVETRNLIVNTLRSNCSCMK